MADLVFPGATAGLLNQPAIPSSYDLVLYKGDYVEFTISLKDSNNAPINISGSTPKAQLKKDYSDATPINFTCTLTGVAGEVKVVLTSAQASLLIAGSYIWDFQVTDSASKTRTYLAGDVTVYDEVTT